MREQTFLEAFSEELIPGRPVLIGCPLDATSTFRSGSAEGPRAIRLASESIESYSPFLDRDLVDFPFCDFGDLPSSGGAVDLYLERLRREVLRVVRQGALPLIIGGEHTVTLPAVRALRHFHPELVVLHVDAHSDLRERYEGSFVNHATVIRRVADLVGPQGLIQLGIRAGTREEYRWMRANSTLLQWEPGDEARLLRRIGPRPVYLTLDLDVLDPACLTGTGNPEAGGWFYEDMERLYRATDRMNLVAADVVELSPGLDPSGASSVTAAKIVRELLLILGNGDR
jgi:agmatinase